MKAKLRQQTRNLLTVYLAQTFTPAFSTSRKHGLCGSKQGPSQADALLCIFLVMPIVENIFFDFPTHGQEF